MIARIQHGRTKIEDYQAYKEFLKRVAIPDYQKTEEFKKLTFLRNIKDTVARFTLFTFWENLDIIKIFGFINIQLQSI